MQSPARVRLSRGARKREKRVRWWVRILGPPRGAFLSWPLTSDLSQTSGGTEARRDSRVLLHFRLVLHVGHVSVPLGAAALLLLRVQLTQFTGHRPAERQTGARRHLRQLSRAAAGGVGLVDLVEAVVVDLVEAVLQRQDGCEAVAPLDLAGHVRAARLTRHSWGDKRHRGEGTGRSWRTSQPLNTELLAYYRSYCEQFIIPKLEYKTEVRTKLSFLCTITPLVP